MAFPPQKTQQVVVQFAGRIPTRKELTSSEKKVIESVLKERDPEHFQLCPDESSHLFQASRQYSIGSAIVTLPTFILSNISVSVFSLLKLGEVDHTKDFPSNMSSRNQEMANILFEIQSVLKGLKYIRAGKIFEFVLGPFEPAEKRIIFNSLLAEELFDVTELNLQFTKHIDIEGELHNFQTFVTLLQPKIEGPFQVALRVDINNRKLVESLDPNEIITFWRRADTKISEYLDTILPA